MKESYGTLSETINGLKKEGYMLDFNISQKFLQCNKSNITLSPEDFEIGKVYDCSIDWNASKCRTKKA
ncbi:hypothetical protein AAKU52_001051 [Pedobacter sp. CG_S7]|uniref:hypothetical protein n=1 Tax=Pedobacter sp. CG_S7 TaxID=3143930 RepID=UPI003397008C